jgi:hypothetical protein
VLEKLSTTSLAGFDVKTTFWSYNQRSIFLPTGAIMQTKPFLSLDDVKKIAAGAEAEARANNWNVAISVVDDGGHLLWLQRMDGAARSPRRSPRPRRAPPRWVAAKARSMKT